MSPATSAGPWRNSETLRWPIADPRDAGGGPTLLERPPSEEPAFTGREDILADLRKRLTKRGRAALAQAISGLGGIGKTQTAVEYAYRYRDKYQAVLWLNAESPLALKTGCGELARRMQLPHPEDDLDQAVLALKHWLETHTGWLLILDNADDPAMLGPFLPDAGQGHILLTSRAQDFQDLGILNPVELRNYPSRTRPHSCSIVAAARRPRPRNETRPEELARELDGLPLALEQAAAYIVARRRATFRRYLEELSPSRPRTARSTRPGPRGIPRVGGHHLGGQLRGGAGESPAAADVLRFSAFLAPDAIPFELLTRGASQLGPPVQRPSPRPTELDPPCSSTTCSGRWAASR